MARKPEVLLTAVALIVVFVGCTWISALSGPRTLRAGDTARYVLSLGGGTGHGAGWLWVLAEVPDSWSLVSNFYTGTIAGWPVSGSGTVVGDPSFYGMPVVGDGFQRLCVEIWEGPVDPGDEGEMTLGFAVTDVPEGEFVLKFWFVASGMDGTPGMGPPAFPEQQRCSTSPSTDIPKGEHSLIVSDPEMLLQGIVPGLWTLRKLGAEFGIVPGLWTLRKLGAEFEIAFVAGVRNFSNNSLVTMSSMKVASA